MSQLERLAKPFPAKYVKPPAQGKFGSYIDHEVITQVLLLIVGPFSFQIEQVFYNTDGLLDGCTAALTVEVDGRTVTITEAGDCEFPQNKKTQGERLKNAASDAIKRCAMRLGCGIEVWTGNDEPFLYDQLRQENAGPVEESVSGDAPAVPAPSPRPLGESAAGAGVASTSPPAPGASPAASPNQLQRVQAKMKQLLADNVKIADRRTAAGLPSLTKDCTADELDGWEALLAQIESELEAPFAEAKS